MRICANIFLSMLEIEIGRCFPQNKYYTGGLGFSPTRKNGSEIGLNKPKPSHFRSVIAQDPACLFYAEFGIMNSELSKLTKKRRSEKRQCEF